MSDLLEGNLKELARWYTVSGEISKSSINCIILGYAELGILRLVREETIAGTW